VNDDQADGAGAHVFHIADGMIVVQPHSSRGRPAKRVPSICERAPWRNAVALLIGAGDAHLGPQRSFGSCGLAGIGRRERVGLPSKSRYLR
jgi:hypothetical protein